ncbi:MAG: DNA alkylation repair protein [Leptolyngbyaceae cyanobacterium bins.59]|nr:DNA alkylation repair protein [Leptolyngbyaceae cyanobacterium bins.59]
MGNLFVESQIPSLMLALQSEGTVQRAEREKAYLKSDLDFHGTPVPTIRKTAKAFSKAHPKLDPTDLFALVETLWQSSYHEMRSLGIALLEQYPHLITVNDLAFLEGLLRQMRTWAHIDWIATGPIAILIERDPSAKTILAKWAIDDSFWIRRTAMLALMKRARTHREDFDLFAQFAAPMVEEQEFFIRKAIGWVLREVSKRQPEWTYAFLREHIDRVSGLTLREGAKYLPVEQREALLDKARATRKKPESVSASHRI